MSNDDKGGELVQPRKDYPLLENPQQMSKVLQLIENNLAGQKVSPFNLSRIRVPSGDDDEFKVETATGVERRAVVTGVITAFRLARAYYIKPFGVGRSQPPDCSSTDGFTGTGKPGGDCTTCPLAAFGTARGPDGSPGQGTACKELRQLLILLPGQMLPHLLSVPPTSLASFTKYSFNLISAGVNYWDVTTKMTLERSTGVPYARIRFALNTELSKQQADIMEPYHDRMASFLKPLVLDASAYEVVTEPVRGATEVPGEAVSPDDIPF